MNREDGTGKQSIAQHTDFGAGEEQRLLTAERLARLVLQCLSEGDAVSIDGLGSFVPKARGECEFVGLNRARVFISYVEEDCRSALRLYDALLAEDFNPWLDKKRLLPGQNWTRAIERAIDLSHFVIFLFSRHSKHKRGGFQAEIRYALNRSRDVPLDDVYIVPVRLEDCDLPAQVFDQLHRVDLFPDWETGVRRLIASLKKTYHRQTGVCPRRKADQ